MIEFFELPALVFKTDRRHTAHTDRMLPELNKQASRMAVIGDLDLFINGQQGCLCRLVDDVLAGRLRQKLGPMQLVHTYIDEFEDMPAAVTFARALANYPLSVVYSCPEYILTTRGPVRVDAVYFADGGKWPRIDRGPLMETRDALCKGLTARATEQDAEIAREKYPLRTVIIGQGPMGLAELTPGEDVILRNGGPMPVQIRDVWNVIDCPLPPGVSADVPTPIAQAEPEAPPAETVPTPPEVQS